MKKKLGVASQPIIIKHDLKTPLVLCEPHIGERTWIPEVYNAMKKCVLSKKAALILSGDLLNADDLRVKGLLSPENTFKQMSEFGERFEPVRDSVKAILQMNHGTRIYDKQLPRQLGLNLSMEWERILTRFKNAKILSPEASELELVLKLGDQKFKGIVWHPTGVSSTSAFVNKIARTTSGYDFIILFHFHTDEYRQIIKRAPLGYYEETKIYFVPPFIEDPEYGRTKGYPPIDAGFLVIYKDKNLLGKEIIRFETIRKSDL